MLLSTQWRLFSGLLLCFWSFKPISTAVSGLVAIYGGASWRRVSSSRMWLRNRCYDVLDVNLEQCPLNVCGSYFHLRVSEVQEERRRSGEVRQWSWKELRWRGCRAHFSGEVGTISSRAAVIVHCEDQYIVGEAFRQGRQLYCVPLRIRWDNLCIDMLAFEGLGC